MNYKRMYLLIIMSHDDEKDMKYHKPTWNKYYANILKFYLKNKHINCIILMSFIHLNYVINVTVLPEIKPVYGACMLFKQQIFTNPYKIISIENLIYILNV